MTPPPAIAPARRPSKRADLIAAQIKDLIMMQAMKPGDRLPQERDLIAQFETSKWTMREALKSLEVQGLITVIPGPGGGARIAEVPEASAMQLLANYFYFRPLSVRDVYDLRIELEPKLVAESIDHLDAGHLARMERSMEITRHPPQSQIERQSHRTAELEFHDILAEACPNVLLAFLCRFMNKILNDWTIYNRTSDADDQEFHEFTCDNMDYHAKLMAAFRARDTDRAVTLMAEHMHLAADATLGLDAAISVTFLPDRRPHRKGDNSAE